MFTESRGEGGMPLNNHKASKPGVAKRPLHINNNLNLPPRASEKNIVKGGRPCKTCGEERRKLYRYISLDLQCVYMYMYCLVNMHILTLGEVKLILYAELNSLYFFP